MKSMKFRLLLLLPLCLLLWRCGGASEQQETYRPSHLDIPVPPRGKEAVRTPPVAQKEVSSLSFLEARSMDEAVSDSLTADRFTEELGQVNGILLRSGVTFEKDGDNFLVARAEEGESSVIMVLDLVNDIIHAGEFHKRKGSLTTYSDKGEVDLPQIMEDWIASFEK